MGEKSGQDDNFKREALKRLQDLDDQTGALERRMTTEEANLEAFEHKTEGNFKVAEKALLAHKTFLNNIDARLVITLTY